MSPRGDGMSAVSARCASVPVLAGRGINVSMTSGGGRCGRTESLSHQAQFLEVVFSAVAISAVFFFSSFLAESLRRHLEERPLVLSLTPIVVRLSNVFKNSAVLLAEPGGASEFGRLLRGSLRNSRNTSSYLVMSCYRDH